MTKYREEGYSGRRSSIIELQRGGPKPPLFVVYPDIFSDFIRHLDSDLPVYGLMGLELVGRQPLQRRIEDRAAFYVEEIQSVQATGPYFISGRCIGGFVAFEIAQQLRSKGQEVALLALFNTPSPFLVRFSTLHDYVINFAREASLLDENVLRWGSKQKLMYVVWQLAYKAYLSIDSFRPRPRKNIDNYQAIRKYSPSVYTGQILYFFASDTRARSFYGREWGWHILAAGGLEIHVVPGTTASMMREPHVRFLADKLRSKLNELHPAPSETRSE